MRRRVVGEEDEEGELSAANEEAQLVVSPAMRRAGASEVAARPCSAALQVKFRGAVQWCCHF